VRGATHSYILEQPYERQDARIMTRISSTSNLLVDYPINSSSRSLPKGSEISDRLSSESRPPCSIGGAVSITHGLEKMPGLQPTDNSSLPVDNGQRTEPKKRSRYSTLPEEVDEALATIYRQLESGMQSSNVLEHFNKRNRALEQELQIERGRTLLAKQNEQTEAELKALEIRFKDTEHELNEMRVQNERLTSDAERYLKKIKDLQAWKQRMKAMMDGDSEEQVVS